VILAKKSAPMSQKELNNVEKKVED